jgi:TolA-binding protein
MATPLFSQPPPPAPSAALNVQQETAALINSAGELFAMSRYEEALAKLAAARKNLNNKPLENLLFTEGECYYNLNDYPRAIAALNAYVKEFPQGPAIIDVRMALGRSYIASKQEEQGIEVLTEVMRASPAKKAEAGLIVAQALTSKGQNDKALAILAPVLADGFLGEEYIDATILSANLQFASGRRKEAVTLMDRLRGLVSESAAIAQMNEFYFKVGDALMKEKAYEEALHTYQKVRTRVELLRSLLRAEKAQKAHSEK